MSHQQTPPLAGVLRVLFLLAVAALAITAVGTGVTTLYEKPSPEDEFGGFEEFDDGDSTADYNRNVGLILGLIGTGVIAAGVLGLGSRFNPLRAGLLTGGVGLVLGGVGMGSTGSDDWLTFLTSGLAMLTLLASFPWLEEGLPPEALFGGARRGGAPGEGGPRGLGTGGSAGEGGEQALGGGQGEEPD